MRPGSRELAIELVRIFVRAGVDRLGDQVVQNSLTSCQFFTNYTHEIETGPKDIDQQLSPDGATNKKYGSRKFYPLPFHITGQFDLVLFRPTFTNEWDGCKVDIVQIGPKPTAGVGAKRIEMGYRIERGKNNIDNPHRFLHLQPTKSFNEDNIILNSPLGLVFGTPSFPINDSVTFSPIYACLLAYVGISPDWKKGLIDELRAYSRHTSTYDFTEFQNSLKTTLHTLLFQRGDKHRFSSSFERKWCALQARMNMLVAKRSRLG